MQIRGEIKKLVYKTSPEGEGIAELQIVVRGAEPLTIAHLAELKDSGLVRIEAMQLKFQGVSK